MTDKTVRKPTSTNAQRYCLAFSRQANIARLRDTKALGGSSLATQRGFDCVVFFTGAAARFYPPFRPENSHKMMPSVINPTSPASPSDLTSAMMLVVTLPKNGRLAPTSSAATIASANNIRPISVNEPIQVLTLCNASMCVLPFRLSKEAPATRTQRNRRTATICGTSVLELGKNSSGMPQNAPNHPRFAVFVGKSCSRDWG